MAMGLSRFKGECSLQGVEKRILFQWERQAVASHVTPFVRRELTDRFENSTTGTILA